MSKKIPDDCMPRCSNCAFYVAEKKDEVGECHRYPPVLVPEDNDMQMFCFPITAEDEWCGEFVRFTN